MANFSESVSFAWLILPVLIFIGRILDVSIGTMRIIYVSRGMKLPAVICGFCEVLIWAIVLSQLIQHLTKIAMFVAYAGGFALGNYVGILIEQKLAVGLVAVRIITRIDASDLVDLLKDMDLSISSLAATGATGTVRLVFCVIRRKDLPRVIQMVRETNPQAYLSFEDTRAVQEPLRNLLQPASFSWLRAMGKWK
jgi:uncharacterized protein YebE (UPF0316 family)